MVSSARESYLRNTVKPEVLDCIKYLDLDKEGPNRGTKNKQDLMIRTLQYLFKWKEGTYNNWYRRLANRLGISPRTARYNYLDPLVSEGIVGKVGHSVFWVGVQQPKPSEEAPDG